MAKLSKQERERLIRMLRAAGDFELADKGRNDGDHEPCRPDDGLRIRSLRLHTTTQRLAIGDRTVSVSPTVSELLSVLAAMGGVPIGRHELADLLDVQPSRMPGIVAEARKALAKLIAHGRTAIRHDPKDAVYWLAPASPLLTVA
jgi:DNA-binding response OmpR family regulator